MFDFDELELKARNCTTADDFVRGPHTILLEILRFSSRMKLKQANQDFVSIGTHLVNAACALRQMQLQSLLHRRKSSQKQTRDGWCFLRSCAVSLTRRILLRRSRSSQTSALQDSLRLIADSVMYVYVHVYLFGCGCGCGCLCIVRLNVESTHTRCTVTHLERHQGTHIRNRAAS